MLTEEEKNRSVYLNGLGWSYAEMAFDIAERRRLDINIERELYEEIAEFLKNEK